MKCRKCGSEKIHRVTYPNNWRSERKYVGYVICENCGEMWREKGSTGFAHPQVKAETGGKEHEALT